MSSTIKVVLKRSVRPLVQSGWQRPGQEVLELLEEKGMGCGEERELGLSSQAGGGQRQGQRVVVTTSLNHTPKEQSGVTF